MKRCGICRKRIWFFEKSKVYPIANQQSESVVFVVDCHEDCWADMIYDCLLEKELKKAGGKKHGRRRQKNRKSS